MAISDLLPLASYGEYTEDTAIPGISGQVFTPENHLAGELSPYLQQHISDPIGWYPWGSEAFAVARHEDRPVFLSVGFSSDHWCHIMGRECFSDVEVAGMMNETCIPVLVDREEYPVLDYYFMETCRVQNGSAGWPLNIFLMPDGRPFFCTTWLPKRTVGKVPGITALLPRIKWLWHMQRSDVERAAYELGMQTKLRLEELSGKKQGGRIGKYKAFEALNDLRRTFDIHWGGFGSVPKFPEANKLIFLLKEAQDPGASKADISDAVSMADVTFRRMWRGGIHDHLGGGFSRYAVDERWIVPHFEKLLCDNALLLFAVSKAQELQDNSFHRLMAEDIIFCATKYFSDDISFSQGFRSAIDGDTSEGEGRYYLWNEDEIKRILPEGDSGLFCAAYAVLPSGNFGNELAGSQMSWNILYEASTVTELAKRYGIKGSDVGRRLYEGRRILLDARDKRHPLKSDNKILMSWNGLMIGALSRASVVFEQTEWREMAERTALFLQKNFQDKDGSWRRCWIDGHAVIDAVTEDYAYFLWGVLELYRAAKHFNGGEKQLNDWQQCAQGLADTMIEKFWDEKNGGLFLSSPKGVNVIKSAEDINSLPSVNAVAVEALTELGHILEEKKYTDYARKIIECFSSNAANEPVNYVSLIASALSWKPVKKKPAPPPAPVPTDEELNREEPVQEQPKTEQETPRTSRSGRRQTRTAGRTDRTAGTDRADRAERRRSAHRTARRQ